MFDKLDVVKLLKELVSIKSTSGFEDKIAKYLINYFKRLGLDVFRDDVGNVIVKRSKKLWIATHLDTVKILSNFSFDGEYCYGTGVCDVRGSIAAILMAESEKNNEYSIVFFVDEEEGGTGSASFEEKPSKCIVMEPTNLTIANKHWGVIEIFVKVKGVEAHGATPWAGINAFERACEMLQTLKNIKSDVIFTVLKVCTENDIYAIPQFCDVEFEYLLRSNSNSLLLKILHVVEKYGDVRVVEVSDPFESREAHKLIERAFLKSNLKPKYSEMPSWTDAVNLYKKGWDTVVFGPGNLEDCHTKREKIKVEDVLTASKVLENLSI